jgi:hypothetical protein
VLWLPIVVMGAGFLLCLAIKNSQLGAPLASEQA